MKKTRVIILGAGISGLSLAWFLSKRSEDIEILLLEKEARAGGWMQTASFDGFLFEKGPRTFRTTRSSALLELILELGLEEELIASAPKAESRYIYFEKDLLKIPENPVSFLFSPLTRHLLPAFLREWKVPPSGKKDESIWDFVSRRLGVKTAQRLFDPLIQGIYAGDIRTLSVRSCFKGLKIWEEEYGSLTKGFFSSRKPRTPFKSFSRRFPSLFSPKNGTQSLIDALLAKATMQVLFDHEVKELKFSPDEAVVVTEKAEFKADHVFSALPSNVIGKLLAPIDEEISSFFKGIPLQGLSVVNLGYKKTLPIPRGFGYLIPTSQNEKILGTVFDSSVFPEQNFHFQETRLTTMIKDTNHPEEECRQRAIDAAKEHLSITDMPDFIRVSKAHDAIPQYPIGHEEALFSTQKKLQRRMPRFHFIGNYLTGASVNECIVKAKAAADHLI